MGIKHVPMWIFALTCAGCVSLIIYMLLTGTALHYKDGHIVFMAPREGWAETRDTEDFNPRCEYRWRMTGDWPFMGRRSDKGAMFYATIVSPQRIQTSWGQNDYLIVQRENKIKAIYFNQDGKQGQIAIVLHQRCLGN